jgi:hypothetical protein
VNAGSPAQLTWSCSLPNQSIFHATQSSYAKILTTLDTTCRATIASPSTMKIAIRRTTTSLARNCQCRLQTSAPVVANHRTFSVLNRPAPNYEGHVPLTHVERVGLAVGSGLWSLLDPRRGGESCERCMSNFPRYRSQHAFKPTPTLTNQPQTSSLPSPKPRRHPTSSIASATPCCLTRPAGGSSVTDRV